MCAHVQCGLGCTSHLYQSLFDRNWASCVGGTVGGAVWEERWGGAVWGRAGVCGELCGEAVWGGSRGSCVGGWGVWRAV